MNMPSLASRNHSRPSIVACHFLIIRSDTVRFARIGRNKFIDYMKIGLHFVEYPLSKLFDTEYAYFGLRRVVRKAVALELLP